MDILHRVGITATPDRVYDALTTLDGLAGWWTTDTTGDPDDTIRFRFGEVGGFDMKVLEHSAASRVEWAVVEGPPEWIGTTVRFDLVPEGEWTIVRFAHAGWREPVEFMGHCTTKWAFFLLGMKDGLEGGKATPFPGELQISSWG